GTDLRPNDNLILVNFGLNFMHRRFTMERYLNNNGRIEDVATGYLGNIIIGRNFYYPNGNEPKLFVQASWQHAFGMADGWYLSYAIGGSSLFGNGSRNESVVQSSLVSYTKISERHVVVMR